MRTILDRFINQKHEAIKCLKVDIQNSKKIAAFVGAGASKAIGIDTWLDVFEKMIKHFDFTYSVKDSIEEGKKYEQIASDLYNLINDNERYRNFMSDQFIPKIGYYNSLTIKILKIFKIILTTNYDNSFEEAFREINCFNEKNLNSNKLLVQKLPQFKLDEILLNSTVVYLHGNNEIKNYIFREEEYKAYYPSNYMLSGHSSPLEDFLKSIFREYKLVFIGFSFEDENFVKFYKKIINTDFLDEKKKYESLYHDRLILEPHYDYVIIPQNELDTTFTKEELIEKFKTGWDDLSLFFEKYGNRFFLKDNFNELLKMNLTKENFNKDIMELKNSIIRKKEKIKFFEEMNLKVIVYDVIKNSYNEIERILKGLYENDLLVAGNSEDIGR